MTEKPVLELRDAGLRFGDRVLWQELSLKLSFGEFLAVVGPNGSGKSSLLKSILGFQALSVGQIQVLGQPPNAKANHRIGYVPQQQMFSPGTPLRARDLVGLGVDGDRWGVRLKSQAHRSRVDELLELVGAQHYAKRPVGTLSGGEQQRLRVAQALGASPELLLCDEPLLSLDLEHQQVVADVVAECAQSLGTAVVFVTHELGPIRDYVDTVLLLGERSVFGSREELAAIEEELR